VEIPGWGFSDQLDRDPGRHFCGRGAGVDRWAGKTVPTIMLISRDSQATSLAAVAGLPLDGLFLKGDPPVPVLQTLLARLDEREFPTPAPMTEFLLRQGRGAPSSAPVRLSSREQAGPQIVAANATNKVIADELGITVHGVNITWQTCTCT
jgi:DNA-binding NarL/FixJ family response regulator